MNAQAAEVLIVGAGPTGMTAALELSRQQVSVRLIEKCAHPSTTSRAIGVQARTLELLQQRGLVQAMLAKGNRGVAASIYGEGRRIFRLEFAHNGSEYGYLLFISQAETEAILRDALARLGVSIEREADFVALAQSDHGDFVTAILKHADGSLEEVHCSYLIDTEGAHSVSRTTLDLQFKGKTHPEEYALGDLYIEGDLAETDFHIFSSEFGFLGLFPMGGGRFRLIASNPLREPSKDTAPSVEDLQKIYDQRSHIPGRFHGMSWSSWFRINSRMIDRLRVGRVFLGGDAAHIHSPAGAQGMNTGIQDMINLAWKLALVLKGQADPRLLDTYTDDRIPVIRNVLTKTEGLTAATGSENPIFRSVFSHIAPWIVGTEFMQENSTERMSQVSLNYRESPLSVSHGGSGALKAGDRLPDLPLLMVGKPEAERLLQLLNPDRFTLLCAHVEDESARPALNPWSWLVDTYSVAPALGREQAFHGVFSTQPSLVLVRPDGYAAFVGTKHSVAALVEYLNTWFPTRKDGDEG